MHTFADAAQTNGTQALAEVSCMRTSVKAHTSSKSILLKDVYRLLLPMSSKWQDVGVLLGLHDRGKLDCIKREGDENSCMRVMLGEWLRQVEPPPRWEDLAEAVEPFNPQIAQKIKVTWLSSTK